MPEPYLNNLYILPTLALANFPLSSKQKEAALENL